MIRKTALLYVILINFTFFTYAATLTPNYGKAENGYNFWLYTPDDTIGKKPLVIFLHGKSLCGSDLNKVKRYGTIDAIEKGRVLDAYVLAPQNPGGSWNPDKIMKTVEWVEDNYDIDTDRVYVLGMSLGGSGTLSFVNKYPDKVAAAIAMCGGHNSKDVSALNLLPLWIVHGTADHLVSVSKSDQLVEKMREADPELPRLIYDRIPGMDHSKPARVFYMPETYEWLFEHSLSDPDREAIEPFELTDDAWKNAYTGLNFGKRKSSK